MSVALIVTITSNLLRLRLYFLQMCNFNLICNLKEVIIESHYTWLWAFTFLSHVPILKFSKDSSQNKTSQNTNLEHFEPQSAWYSSASFLWWDKEEKMNCLSAECTKTWNGSCWAAILTLSAHCTILGCQRANQNIHFLYSLKKKLKL